MYIKCNGICIIRLKLIFGLPYLQSPGQHGIPKENTGDLYGRPAMMVALLLLRGHLLRVLRLGLIVVAILLRRTIHRLFWLVALLVRLLLRWLSIRLVIGRLLGRLVVWRLLGLLRLLPRITHVPHGIQVPGRAGTSLCKRPDHKKDQGDDKYDHKDRENHVEDKPRYREAKRKDDGKHYWDDMREKPDTPATAVRSIVIVHFWFLYSGEALA